MSTVFYGDFRNRPAGRNFESGNYGHLYDGLVRLLSVQRNLCHCLPDTFAFENSKQCFVFACYMVFRCKQWHTLHRMGAARGRIWRLYGEHAAK